MTTDNLCPLTAADQVLFTQAPQPRPQISSPEQHITAAAQMPAPTATPLLGLSWEVPGSSLGTGLGQAGDPRPQL